MAMGRELPSEHEKRRVEAEKAVVAAQEEQKRRDARVRQAFGWLLKQENGRVVWGEIFRLCGYNQPSLSFFTAGDVAPLKTECRDAQRVVYLQLRKLAPPDLLAQAEFEAEFGPKPEKKDDKGGK